MKKDNQGFTLLEVLIAGLVLSIGIMGTLFLVTSVMSNNRFNNRMTTATILAQDKMEEIQQLGYMGIDPNDSCYTEDYYSIPDFPSYKRVTDIDCDSPSARMKKITVRVYWDSDDRLVSMKTIITQ